MSALDTQVGGSHYRDGGTIQPVQYIEANSLPFLEGSVVKRVTRHSRPTGKGRQDIEKAIHELQLLLELRYPESTQGAPVDWPLEPQPQWATHFRHGDAKHPAFWVRKGEAGTGVFFANAPSDPVMAPFITGAFSPIR